MQPMSKRDNEEITQHSRHQNKFKLKTLASNTAFRDNF